MTSETSPPVTSAPFILAAMAGAEAMRRIRSLRGAQPVPIAYGVSNGTTLQRLGKWDETLDVLNEASSQAKLLNSEFMRANAQHQLARALMGSGPFETIEANLADAERIWMANETGNRDRLGDLLRTRAELAMARGNYESARQLIDAALSETQLRAWPGSFSRRQRRADYRQ